MRHLSIGIQNNLDIIFFLYGAAFLVMGFIVLLQPRKEPSFILPNRLWILGWFALIHGTNEILEMWLIIKQIQNPIYHSLQSICLLTSYVFLFEFGRRCFEMIKEDTNNCLNPVSRCLLWRMHPLIVIAILSISFLSSDFHKTASILSRYLLGFPGGVLAGVGILNHYFTRKKKMKFQGIKTYVLLAGIAFILYGILGGLIVARGDFFPANWLNKEMFLSVFKLPVQIFRAICAICITWGIVNILKIINWEVKEKMKNTLFESSQDCVATLTPDGKYITINAAGLHLHGINDPLKIIGTYCHDWFAPEKRQELKEAVNKAGGGKNSTLRHKSINKDTTETWWDSMISPVKDLDEQIRSVLIVSRDITKQQIDEEKIKTTGTIQDIVNKTLRISLHKYSLASLLKKFLENLASIEWLDLKSQTAIFLIDKKTDMLFLKAHHNMTEISQKKHTKLPIGECPCGKAVTSGETVFYDSNSSHSLYCAPIKTKAYTLGVLTIFLKKGHKKNENEISFLNDITRLLAGIMEHKILEEEHSQLVNIIEQSEYSITLMDSDGDIIYVNDAFKKDTGFQKKDVLGKKPEVLKKIFDADNFKKIWPQVQQGETLRHIASQTKKDGTKVKMTTVIFPIKDDDEKIVSYAMMQRDISSEVELESQLRQSQKMEAIGLLAGGIAHDFNNILMVINGYAQFTAERFEPESPTALELDEIKSAGTRAAALTHQLLAFSRKQIFVPKTLNLNDLIENMNNMLQRILGENIAYETDYNNDIKPIKADPNHIEQVILNLSVNAHDAMPNGGKLTIKTENISFTEQSENIPFEIKYGNYVLLSVQDTGAGITPKIISRIFEPFFTTKELGAGTGLGLSTVYGIVKQSGGVIAVDSKPNEGSTFKIYFPAIQAEHKPVTPRKTEKKNIKINAAIILVDDDASVRGMTHRILIDKGVTVLDFRSAEDALLFSERYEGEIDVLITDILLEKMNGFELAEKIREKRPNVKIIFMSGHTDPKILKQELVDNKFPFLQKPVKMDILFDNIANVLNQKDDEENNGRRY